MARSDKKELTEKDLQQLETMAGFGLTNNQMAAILGMGRATLQRRIAEDPIVSETIEKGKSKTAYQVTKKLYDKCMEGNVTSILFWLKCRCNWSELGSFDEREDPYPEVV